MCPLPPRVTFSNLFSDKTRENILNPAYWTYLGLDIVFPFLFKFCFRVLLHRHEHRCDSSPNSWYKIGHIKI